MDQESDNQQPPAVTGETNDHEPEAKQPLSQPQEPAAAAESSAPPTATTTTPNPVLASSDPSDKDRKKSFINSKLLVPIVAAVVLLVGGFLAYLTYFSPSAQSRRMSNSFMHSITTGDVDGAAALSGEVDASYRTFLETASKGVHGSYELSQSTFDDGTGYYLYTLTGAEKNYARTIVQKENGQRVVYSFVYSAKALALVPGSSQKQSSANDATTTKTEETPTQPAANTATALACLTQDDYKWFFYDKKPASVTFDSVYNPSQYTSNATGDMFFKPDSTTEDSLAAVYDDWADFARHNTDKQWKFRLEGSTYGADSGTASSKQLANERAERVKSQLISRDVPSDRIIVDAPHNYADEGQDDSKSEIFRRVQIVVDPTCTAGSSSLR